MKIVSVVVPVYNVELYVEKCIRSILSQTYPYFELILVDDGSTDRSGKICEEYARFDERVRVVHQENGGLSAARNTGIDAAKGELITFVDSDDFVHTEFLEHLVKALEETDSQVAISSHEVFYQTSYQEHICEKKEAQPLNVEDLYNISLVGYPFFVSAWAKLYDIKLFEHIRYPKGELYEDLAIVYKLFSGVERACFIDEPLYFYYQRQDSILHSAFNTKKLKYLENALNGLEFIKKNYPQCQSAAEAKVLAGAVDTMVMIGRSDSPELIWIQKQCHSYIKKYRSAWIMDKRMRKVHRICMLLSYLRLDILFSRYVFPLFDRF